MAQFALFLYDDPSDFTELSPEDIQQIIEKYRAWGEGLSADDRLVTSSKLVDGQGRVLSNTDGAINVVDGPFSETKEVIGGFFVLRAEDFTEAAELAKGCPHLEYGGKIELRQIDEV